MTTTMQEPDVEARRHGRRWWPLVAALVVVVAGVAAVVFFVAGASDEPTFAYELNGTLEEEGGGAAAVSLGGNVGPEGYSFGPNEGLALNVDLGDSYTIEMRFRLEDPENMEAQGRGGARYAKLLDYRDLSMDAGLYVHNLNKLAFVRDSCGDVTDPAQGCAPIGPHRSLWAAPDNWQLGTFHTVRLVRDGEGDTVTIYLDGTVQRFSPATSGEPLPNFPAVEALVDPIGDATLGGQPLLHVMVDDETTFQTEVLGGEIDYIRITIP